MKSNAKSLFGLSSPEEWRDIIIRSVNEPEIQGQRMPRFPHADIQDRWVGSHDAAAINEAYLFYNHVRSYAEALGKPLQPNSKVLDFGVGWGRFQRLFWYDVDEAGLHGVDIDLDVLSACRMLGVPGLFDLIEARGVLPFEDETFDCAISYSVFSHLPEQIADHWMAEVSRVCKPGAVFCYTTEPYRFLEFIRDIKDPATHWHAGLARFASQMPIMMSKFRLGEFCFLPTSGGGEYMTAEVYGDTAIPQSYIEKNWEKYFRMRAYIDDPNLFWQAFVAVQKA